MPQDKIKHIEAGLLIYAFIWLLNTHTIDTLASYTALFVVVVVAWFKEYVWDMAMGGVTDFWDFVATVTIPIIAFIIEIFLIG